MGLWSKLTGGQTADSPRTPREKRRRAAEIRNIDTGTRNWLNAGGIHPRKGR